jgi:hypothetical protein
MVRRGSTVRVRQRALQRPRKTGSLCSGIFAARRTRSSIWAFGVFQSYALYPHMSVYDNLEGLDLKAAIALRPGAKGHLHCLFTAASRSRCQRAPAAAARLWLFVAAKRRNTSVGDVVDGDLSPFDPSPVGETAQRDQGNRMPLARK